MAVAAAAAAIGRGVLIALEGVITHLPQDKIKEWYWMLTHHPEVKQPQEHTVEVQMEIGVPNPKEVLAKTPSATDGEDSLWPLAGAVCLAVGAVYCLEVAADARLTPPAGEGLRNALLPIDDDTAARAATHAAAATVGVGPVHPGLPGFVLPSPPSTYTQLAPHIGVFLSLLLAALHFPHTNP